MKIFKNIRVRRWLVIFTLVLSIFGTVYTIDKVKNIFNDYTELVEELDEAKSMSKLVDRIIEERFLIYTNSEIEYSILTDGTVYYRIDNTLNKKCNLDPESLAMIKDLVNRQQYRTICENNDLTQREFYISYKNNSETLFCSSNTLDGDFGRMYSIIHGIVTKSEEKSRNQLV